jgi:hypothetical protein
MSSPGPPTCTTRQVANPPMDRAAPPVDLALAPTNTTQLSPPAWYPAERRARLPPRRAWRRRHPPERRFAHDRSRCGCLRGARGCAQGRSCERRGRAPPARLRPADRRRRACGSSSAARPSAEAVRPRTPGRHSSPPTVARSRASPSPAFAKYSWSPREAGCRSRRSKTMPPLMQRIHRGCGLLAEPRKMDPSGIAGRRGAAWLAP